MDNPVVLAALADEHPIEVAERHGLADGMLWKAEHPSRFLHRHEHLLVVRVRPLRREQGVSIRALTTTTLASRRLHREVHNRLGPLLLVGLDSTRRLRSRHGFGDRRPFRPWPGLGPEMSERILPVLS